MIFLGTLANSGTDVVNNRTTAVPFTIPPGATALRLQPSAATQLAVIKQGDDAAFLPAGTDMLALAGTGYTDIPIGPPGNMTPGNASRPITLAIRKTDAGAGTCKVFAIAL